VAFSVDNDIVTYKSERSIRIYSANLSRNSSTYKKDGIREVYGKISSRSCIGIFYCHIKREGIISCIMGKTRACEAAKGKKNILA